MSEWLRTGEIKCWCCLEWFTDKDIERADGFCPECDAEIDREEFPYIEEPPQDQP